MKTNWKMKSGEEELEMVSLSVAGSDNVIEA